MEEVHDSVLASENTIDTESIIDDSKNITLNENGSYKIVLEIITNNILKKFKDLHKASTNGGRITDDRSVTKKSTERRKRTWDWCRFERKCDSSKER